MTFEEWTKLEKTRELLREVAYDFGDMVKYPENWLEEYENDEEVDNLVVLLRSAYYAGKESKP